MNHRILNVIAALSLAVAVFSGSTSKAETPVAADPLQRLAPDKYAYNTFAEAVQQIESISGFKVSCADDVAKVMEDLWSRKDFVRVGASGDGAKEAPVKQLVDRICGDLGMAWNLDAGTNKIALKLSWQVDDPRSAAELLKYLLDPSYHGDFKKSEDWRRTFDALLSKECNFAKSLKVRQRSELENWFRGARFGEFRGPRSIELWGSDPLARTHVKDSKGNAYAFVMFIQPIQFYPGHGSVSYYWFSDDGTLAGAGLMNTGHRHSFVDLTFEDHHSDPSEVGTELQFILKFNGQSYSIARFVLDENGLQLKHLTDITGAEMRNDGLRIGQPLVP